MTVLTLILAVSTGTLGCRAENDSWGEPTSDSSVERIDPAATIGLLDGDPEYLFGDIVAVAVDAYDRTYVGDRIGASVRVYAPDGAFLKDVATEGQGPGEMEGWPANLEFGPAGRLYVRDATRVTVFAPRTAGAVADSLVATWSVGGYGNLTSSRSRVAADGSYFYPDGAQVQGELARIFYHGLTAGGPSSDTLIVPPYPELVATRFAFYRLGSGGGRIVPGLNRVPFAPAPSWDVTRGGTLVSSDGAWSRLLETDLAGDTIRVIELPLTESSEIPEAERRDSLAALAARIDSLPVPLDEVINLGVGVAERSLPTAYPSVLSLTTGADGTIWVERWPPSVGTRRYDILDREGNHLARLDLAAGLASEPPVYVNDHSLVGVITNAETGVEQVVRFGISEAIRQE